MRLVDRIAYINHDIDDALRAGVISSADLPADAIAIRATAVPVGSTRSCTISSSIPPQAGDIVQGERVGGARDGRAADVHVRAGCTLGPQATREGAKIQLVVPVRCSTITARVPRRSRHRSRRETSHARVTDYLAGMTDQFLHPRV